MCMTVYTLVFKALNYLIEKDLLTILNVGKLWKSFDGKADFCVVFVSAEWVR